MAESPTATGSNSDSSAQGSSAQGSSAQGSAVQGSAAQDNAPADLFELWDLRVEVTAGDKPMVCDHQVGEYFDVHGELIIFPEDGKRQFPLYPLAALLPLLPAKQRMTHANDWMTTDALIACPDPHCGALFKITRTGKRQFSHAETTLVPLPD